MSRHKRLSIAAATAYVPVHWLNLTEGRSGNRRIAKLLQTANEIATLPGTQRPTSIDLLTWKLGGARGQRPNPKSMRLARDLRRQLSRYKVYPEISLGNRGQWRQHWKPLTARLQVPITISAQGDTETYLFGEDDVALRILELARQGNLHRVRKCHCCGKWLFAWVRHQNYCHIKCQQSNFRRSEKFKIKRKLYMRDHRRKELERKRAESRIGI